MKDETRGRSLTRQVHERLQERVREAGKGAERRIEEALERRPGWLRDRRRTGAIELGLLLDALDYLGEDPRRFFRLALGEDEERNSSIRLLGEPPPIVRLAHASLATKPSGVPCQFEELETLDRIRYFYPRRVVSIAEATIARTPRELLPYLLGVTASAYRHTLDLDQAEHAIAAAMEIARQQGDQPAIAHLLKRRAYIVGYRCDYAGSLRLAEQATGIYIVGCDLARVGRGLVDQGLWLFFLGRHREGIAVQKAALEYLPESAQWFRFAALQSLGIAYQALGEPQEALLYADRSEELLPYLSFSTWCAGRARWLRASISTDLGRLTESEEHLIEMIEIYQSRHFGETALATVALVQIKLLLAKPLEAYETAKALLRLMEPLRYNQITSTAIADLLRGGATGLTLTLVERVKTAIEAARMRPDWCLLSAGATKEKADDFDLKRLLNLNLRSTKDKRFAL